MEIKKKLIFKENLIAYLFLIPAMAMFIGFIIVPVVQSFMYSLTSWDGLGPKIFIGLKNYIDIFSASNSIYRVALRNNFLWLLSSITVALSIGLFQANMLVRGRFRGSNIFQLIFFLPVILSSIVVAIAWDWIYEPTHGVVNTVMEMIGLEKFILPWLGNRITVMPALLVVNIWFTYGFCTVVFSAAIQTIDETLYDAAKMDGCSSWSQFWNVTFPSIRKTMTTVLLLLMIWSFQVFDLIFAMTKGGPGFASYVISYYTYAEAFVRNHTGYGAALAITLSIIIFIFSIIFIRIRERRED